MNWASRWPFIVVPGLVVIFILFGLFQKGCSWGLSPAEKLEKDISVYTGKIGKAASRGESIAEFVRKRHEAKKKLAEKKKKTREENSGALKEAGDSSFSEGLKGLAGQTLDKGKRAGEWAKKEGKQGLANSHVRTQVDAFDDLFRENETKHPIAPLAAIERLTVDGKIAVISPDGTITVREKTPSPNPPKTDTVEESGRGGYSWLWIVILIVIAGGAAIWFFKFRK